MLVEGARWRAVEALSATRVAQGRPQSRGQLHVDQSVSLEPVAAPPRRRFAGLLGREEHLGYADDTGEGHVRGVQRQRDADGIRDTLRA